ncbi:MAG: hypothetical protein AB1726_00150 [Planctomycetota bacterium]
MKLRRLLPRVGLSLAILAAIDQVALYTLLRDDRFLQRAAAPFDPPVFSPSQAATLARIRAHVEDGEGSPADFRFDAELGWCNPRNGGFGDFAYDWAGCRIAAGPLAREKTPGVRRVVTLGCSMTHGEEVGPTETWCAVLDASRADVEVANLGVAAYGLDQALLRWRRDGVPLAGDEVWLGWLPEAALRAINLYRPALRHWSLEVCFKPRFVLGEDGGLVLVPNPAQNLADIVRLCDSQAEFLAALGGHDPWVARAPAAYAPRGSRLSHHSFVGRILLSVHEAGGRDLARRLGGPGEEAYRILRAIVLTTAREAGEHGARFRLLILPCRTDLERRDAAGRAAWEPLCADLAAAGVEILDLTGPLDASGLSRADLFAPQGHYSAAGNRVVAEALAAAIDR